MAAKLTRLTHKIAIQLLLMSEICTFCSSCSRRLVRKLLDTPSYLYAFIDTTYLIPFSIVLPICCCVWILSLFKETLARVLGLSRRYFKSMSSGGLWRRVVLWWDTNVSQVPDVSVFTSPWRWRQQEPLKRWYPTTTPHGVTAPQKT
jgi:hypothetical protein